MKQSIILLHGLFGGLSNWQTVLDRFGSDYNILVPQLPLFEKHQGDTVEFLTGFLENLVDQSQLNNVILVGNSLGGHIAIRYTWLHPDKVAGLVLTGSSGLYENQQVGSYLRRANHAYLKERVAATFYDPAMATDQLVAEVMSVTTDRYKCLCIIKAAKATQRDSVQAILPQINTPALLIWGHDDTITPPLVAYQFRDNLPKAKLIMLARCGHAPMMEKPEAFNDALENFLSKFPTNKTT